MPRKKFSIYNKLTLGFGITTLAIIAGSLFNYYNLEKNIATVRKIANEHAPATQALNDLYFEVSNSKMLIKNWVFIEAKSNTPNKQQLKAFHKKRYPNLKDTIRKLSANWETQEKEQLNTIAKLIEDSLIPQHRFIMNKLNNFEDYDNPMLLFEAMSMVEQEEDPVMALSNQILERLDQLNGIITDKYDEAKTRMENSNAQFRNAILVVGAVLILISLATGFYLSYQIVQPIRKLQRATQEISRGNLDVRVGLNSQDELQALSDNFDIMTENLKMSRQKLERANQKLLKSQQSLEKSNSTKDKFFSIIAHDLRAPFSAFVSVSEVLAHSPESVSESRRQSFALNIYNSAKHLNNLIDNLLQWSRSQTERLDFNPREGDLNKLLDQAIPIVKTQAQQKEVEVINATEEPVKASFDHDLIAVVVRNLLSNALKYSKPNTIVTLKAEYENENKVKVSVADQGIGIAREDIPKLFRIDVNTKYIGQSTEKGTGLGLILCKEFVEKHQGNIFVSSAVHKGSVFSFTLPKTQA
ncbi:MAG: ATP-binding protein [Bacteroidota bacterium]